jgi:hypothetical protein
MQIALTAMLLTMLLLPGGAAPVGAGGISGVTGGIGLEQPWGRVWIQFNVHQEDPITYEAKGMIKARVDNPQFGTKRLWYEPRCVSFTEVDGKPAAILVATIVRREGWDAHPAPGNPGEHLRWRVVDGGTPGAKGDTWSIDWYDDWKVEYWPAEIPPGCSDYQATSTLPVNYGNLIIH